GTTTVSEVAASVTPVGPTRVQSPSPSSHVEVTLALGEEVLRRRGLAGANRDSERRLAGVPAARRRREGDPVGALGQAAEDVVSRGFGGRGRQRRGSLEEADGDAGDPRLGVLADHTAADRGGALLSEEVLPCERS